jgi:hypothetical protein
MYLVAIWYLHCHFDIFYGQLVFGGYFGNFFPLWFVAGLPDFYWFKHAKTRKYTK